MSNAANWFNMRMLYMYLIFNILLMELTNSDGHSHDASEQAPAYKYSRQANEPIKVKDNHAHTSEHEEQFTAQHSEKLKWENTVPRRHTKFRQSRLDLSLGLQALGATLLISIVPFVILFLVPVDSSREHEPFLKVLLGFASGGLLGDAFLHLIPHAIQANQARTGTVGHGHSHDGGHHEHDLSVGLWVLSGIGLFLVVEKLLRLFKSPHSHSHVVKKKMNDAGIGDRADASGDSPRKKGKSDAIVKPDNEIKVAGYLNLAADVIHNFTDGLAIGASFLAGGGIGYMTTITVIFHEIPHEIGDYAILLQSGMSRKKAISLQLVTAVGALSGTVFSLLAEGFGESATSWILPFTAGGFIYIATVTVIPELLQDSKLSQSIKEIIALVLGVVLMVLVAKFE